MDPGLDHHSRKGSGSYLIRDEWLDAAVSFLFLFYVVSISESRHFVSKCYVSRICSNVR